MDEIKKKILNKINIKKKGTKFDMKNKLKSNARDKFKKYQLLKGFTTLKGGLNLL